MLPLAAHVINEGETNHLSITVWVDVRLKDSYNCNTTLIV